MRTLAELIARGPQGVWSPEEAAAAAEPAAESKPAEATPAAAAPAAESAPAPAAAAAPAPAAKPEPDWKDKRIASLTAQLRQAQRAPAPAPTPAPGPAAAAPLDPVKDFNDRVAAEAAKIAPALTRQELFNRDCNAAVEAGQAKHGKAEFDAAIATLTSLVNTPTEQVAYFEMINAALETGQAPDLIFELGSNPEEAQRILGLSPLKMAVELTKKTVKTAPPPPQDPSNLPKPLTPVDAKGGRHEQIDPADPDKADNLPIGEWMARREKQVAAQPRR